MAIEKALLLIADIGGYTRFMKEHRFSLAHAQDTIAQLLETVIDAASSFKLAKIEGDAAFFYLVGEGSADFPRQISDIRRAFLARRRQLELDRMCTCNGCLQVGALTLKFVTHSGEVAFQKVKHLTELAGVDVILVHRMLKNDVPLREYVLMTPAVLEKLPAELRQRTHLLEHDFEGMGRTATHYVALDEIAPAPPPAAPNLVRKLWRKVTMEARSLPFLLGLKEPCQDFRNLEIVNGPDTPKAR
jgi:hypothetical protein